MDRRALRCEVEGVHVHRGKENHGCCVRRYLGAACWASQVEDRRLVLLIQGKEVDHAMFEHGQGQRKEAMEGVLACDRLSSSAAWLLLVWGV